MEENVTRKEFIEGFLPSKESISTTKKIARLFGFAFIIYFVLRFASGLTLNGWLLFSAVALSVGILKVAVNRYRRAKIWLRKRKRTEALSYLLAFERLFRALLMILIGAVLYRNWLKEPIQAYADLGIFCFFYLVEIKDKESEPGATLNVAPRRE